MKRLVTLKPLFRSPGHWDNKENILQFLSEIKLKYNLNTREDWNSITQKQILTNGGRSLLTRYSIYKLKCMACPEGESTFKLPKQSIGYWDNKENILQFLKEIKQKYNLHTPEDWNSITRKLIQTNGGSSLLLKHSLLELKCMACPEGNSTFTMFNNSKRQLGYWNNKENILQFLSDIKQKYNLNTPEDWNSITQKHIQTNGGKTLLRKYSVFELKCMACPEGKPIFNNTTHSPGYWNNNENILQFLSDIKRIYNLNTPEEWNSITQKHIHTNGGGTLLSKLSLYELKCMACPEGKSLFNRNRKQPSTHWDNQENILQFLKEIKHKYNLNTPDDWNSITQKQIQANGGRTLLQKHSLFKLKCMACPEGKPKFIDIKPKVTKQSSGYWNNKENILQFLKEIKQKYNLNTPDDWNSITTIHIQTNGGSTLLYKYSLFELKCMACPEGQAVFNSKLKQHIPPEYWENESNIDKFMLHLQRVYNLQTPLDWKRISKSQIISQGGKWLLNDTNKVKFNIQFDGSNEATSISWEEIISNSISKRSSQRWLFLQVQKLYPHEEIIEDYYHSDISRETGLPVQFDIFMMQQKIAIEYHGQQHYEDIPSGFCSLETYQHRDQEKEKLCTKYGIKLVVIPYWWDNKLDSLRSTLYKALKK